MPQKLGDSFGLFVLLLAGLSQSAQAQRHAPEIRGKPAVLFATGPCPTAVVPSRDCFHYDESAQRGHIAARAPDHRYEGLAIGGGLGAATGIVLGAVICGQTDDPDWPCAKLILTGGLGLGLLGGFAGLMIGAQFPKEPAVPTPRDSMPS